MNIVILYDTIENSDKVINRLLSDHSDRIHIDTEIQQIHFDCDSIHKVSFADLRYNTIWYRADIITVVKDSNYKFLKNRYTENYTVLNL